MGKVKKVHVEGKTAKERQQIRGELGSLRELTVQPKTRQRYDKALELFWAYLREEGLSLPRQASQMDVLMSNYIEHLWESGAGRALASDSVAAVQDADPQIRRQLQGTWRLLKAWNSNELPNRAPPLPEEALEAMVGFAIFKKEYGFAVSLLLGYYGVLRTGELLSVTSRDITLTSPKGPAVISLGLTKGGKRAGAAESITVTLEQPLKWLWAWQHSVPEQASLCANSPVWRKMFNDTLEALNFETAGFRPYSLRRGGATFWFKKWGSLDRLLLLGRWHAAKTARIYINEGLAILANLTLKWNPTNRQYRQIYLSSLSQAVPRLEPTLKGKQGGRGRKVQKSKLKRKKAQKKERASLVMEW